MPDDSMQREELQRLVKKTVMAHPEHLRENLLLSYFHQFPYKQIGDILEIPLEREIAASRGPSPISRIGGVQ
jgi:DNA-directed RNA polymerase specialized sigma24 family protein